MDQDKADPESRENEAPPPCPLVHDPLASWGSAYAVLALRGLPDGGRLFACPAVPRTGAACDWLDSQLLSLEFEKTL